MVSNKDRVGGKSVFEIIGVCIDVDGFFFSGGVKPHPLECRNFFSGGKVGGPGGK